jgi:hypothetical protein
VSTASVTRSGDRRGYARSAAVVYRCGAGDICGLTGSDVEPIEQMPAERMKVLLHAVEIFAAIWNDQSAYAHLLGRYSGDLRGALRREVQCGARQQIMRHRGDSSRVGVVIPETFARPVRRRADWGTIVR